MIEKDWRELGNFGYLERKGFAKPVNNKRYAGLLDKTMDVDQHPEDYDGPCLCYECRSN